MLAKAAVVQKGKEKVVEIGDVSKPGDLKKLITAALRNAGLNGLDLWNFGVQVTKHSLHLDARGKEGVGDGPEILSLLTTPPERAVAG